MMTLLKRTRHRRRLETILSTSEVANLCGVAPRTVAKWVDAGLLPGSWKIPGSGDRRIPSEVLMLFFRENNIPVPKELRAILLSSEPRALLVAVSAATEQIIRTMQPEWEITTTGLVGAGFRLAHHKQVVIDLAGCWCEGQELAAMVGEFSPNTHILLIHPDDRQPPAGLLPMNQTWLAESCSPDALKSGLARDPWK